MIWCATRSDDIDSWIPDEIYFKIYDIDDSWSNSSRLKYNIFMNWQDFLSKIYMFWAKDSNFWRIDEFCHLKEVLRREDRDWHDEISSETLIPREYPIR